MKSKHKAERPNNQLKVAEEFDGYHDIYSDVVNKSLILPGMDVDYFTRVKAGYLVDLCQQNFAKPNSLDILDLGCGVGNYHPLLSGKFNSISGIDVSSQSIEVAKNQNPNVSYQSYGGGKLPYKSNSFDVAFAICVVHHVPVPGWNLFFDEMYRVLRDGGMGIVFEHNPLNPLTMRVVNNCPFDKDAVLLKKSKTLELFGHAGFESCWSRSIISIPTFGRISRGLDLTIGVLPFGAQYVVSGKK